MNNKKRIKYYKKQILKEEKLKNYSGYGFCALAFCMGSSSVLSVPHVGRIESTIFVEVVHYGCTDESGDMCCIFLVVLLRCVWSDVHCFFFFLVVYQIIVFSFNSKRNLFFKIGDSCMSFMVCTSSSYAFEQCYAGVWCNKVMSIMWCTSV
jgi:hypothetical protein